MKRLYKACLRGMHKKSWEAWFSAITSAINMMVHSGSGVHLLKMMFGKEFRTSLESIVGTPEPKMIEPAEHLRQMANQFTILYFEAEQQHKVQMEWCSTVDFSKVKITKIPEDSLGTSDRSSRTTNVISTKDQATRTNHGQTNLTSGPNLSQSSNSIASTSSPRMPSFRSGLQKVWKLVTRQAKTSDQDNSERSQSTDRNEEHKSSTKIDGDQEDVTKDADPPALSPP